MIRLHYKLAGKDPLSPSLNTLLAPPSTPLRPSLHTLCLHSATTMYKRFKKKKVEQATPSNQTSFQSCVHHSDLKWGSSSTRTKVSTIGSAPCNKLSCLNTADAHNPTPATPPATKRAATSSSCAPPSPSPSGEGSESIVITSSLSRQGRLAIGASSSWVKAEPTVFPLAR